MSDKPKKGTPKPAAVFDKKYSWIGHTHPMSEITGYTAPANWTYVILGSDFSTSSGSAQNVTGLYFTPAANINYEVECVLMCKNDTAGKAFRPGCSGPTCDQAVAWVMNSRTTSTMDTDVGNLSSGGAVDSTSGNNPGAGTYYLARIQGIIISGASPSGNFQVRLQTATTSTSTIRAGSFLRYRVIA